VETWTKAAVASSTSSTLRQEHRLDLAWEKSAAKLIDGYRRIVPVGAVGASPEEADGSPALAEPTGRLHRPYTTGQPAESRPGIPGHEPGFGSRKS
jgi:hypothetical protein